MSNMILLLVCVCVCVIIKYPPISVASSRLVQYRSFTYLYFNRASDGGLMKSLKNLNRNNNNDDNTAENES